MKLRLAGSLLLYSGRSLCPSGRPAARPSPRPTTRAPRSFSRPNLNGPRRRRDASRRPGCRTTASGIATRPLGGTEIVVVDPAKKTRDRVRRLRGGRRGLRAGAGRRRAAAADAAARRRTRRPRRRTAVVRRQAAVDVARRHARRSSCATGISGCATSPPARSAQLTTDGAKDFGYATDNAGWSDAATARSCSWSPDSKKIATQQQDERKVGEMYLVRHRRSAIRRCASSKYPAARRSASMAMLHRVVIDVDTGKVTRLQMAPDFHRAHARRQHQHERLQLEPGRLEARARVGRRAITSTSWLRVADTATGAVRTVFDGDRADAVRVAHAAGRCCGRRTR